MYSYRGRSLKLFDLNTDSKRLQQPELFPEILSAASVQRSARLQNPHWTMPIAADYRQSAAFTFAVDESSLALDRLVESAQDLLQLLHHLHKHQDRTG